MEYDGLQRRSHKIAGEEGRWFGELVRGYAMIETCNGSRKTVKGGSVPSGFLLLLCASIAISGCRDRRVAALDAGDDREIRLYAETSWEVTQALLYEVRSNGAIGGCPSGS